MLKLKYYKSFENRLKLTRCKSCRYFNNRLILGYPNEIRYKTYCEYLNEEMCNIYDKYCLHFKNKLSIKYQFYCEVLKS